MHWQMWLKLLKYDFWKEASVCLHPYACACLCNSASVCLCAASAVPPIFTLLNVNTHTVKHSNLRLFENVLLCARVLVRQRRRGRRVSDTCHGVRVGLREAGGREDSLQAGQEPLPEQRRLAMNVSPCQLNSSIYRVLHLTALYVSLNSFIIKCKVQSTKLSHLMWPFLMQSQILDLVKKLLLFRCCILWRKKCYAIKCLVNVRVILIL